MIWGYPYDSGNLQLMSTDHDHDLTSYSGKRRCCGVQRIDSVWFKDLPLKWSKNSWRGPEKPWVKRPFWDRKQCDYPNGRKGHEGSIGIFSDSSRPRDARRICQSLKFFFALMVEVFTCSKMLQLHNLHIGASSVERGRDPGKLSEM